jgi:hypothetical protein
LGRDLLARRTASRPHSVAALARAGRCADS